MKISALLAALGAFALPVLAIAQVEDFDEVAEVVERRAIERPGKSETPEQATQPDEPEIEPSRAEVPPLGPKYIKLHLLDGNVISGDLTVSEIEVDTQFGNLVIPIEKIQSFTPGLDSYPQLKKQIDDLIANLGSDDYKTREQAHKDLAAMGVKVRSELERHSGDENAEVKRHVGEILKELEVLSEEQDDLEEGASADQPWIRLDTVVTTDFTVVGKVAPTEFKVESKYGPLTVSLSDVRRGERNLGIKEALRRNLTVTAENLAQRSFKNSGIRVQAGDKITVRAEGSIVMSPWGSNASSGPDGAPNYGWYVPSQIAGGTLVARIGERGTVFKVGRQSTFTAKQSGTVQFAIGMQGEYANEGYQFPGEYRLKIKVDPK